MDFFATNRFKKSIEKLLSKKNHYHCVLLHIYDELHGKTDDELFENGYKLNNVNPYVSFLKVRIATCGKNGKSEGFRLLAFVHKKECKYYFLEIYPKTGPLHKSNAKADERKECLTELQQEKSSNKLHKVIFDNRKKEIVFK